MATEGTMLPDRSMTADVSFTTMGDSGLRKENGRKRWDGECKMFGRL